MKRVAMVLTVGLTAVLSLASPASAQAGDLDSSFGRDGIVKTNFGSGGDWILDIAVQPDGKVVAVGRAGQFEAGAFAVARYNEDGSLDRTFSEDGKATTDFTSSDDAALGVGIQSDGRIVVAGTAGTFPARFALARYHGDGTLDKSFGGDGKVRTDLSSGFDVCIGLVIQADGKIVAAGSVEDGERFAVARYNSDGSLDTTFSDDGWNTANFTAGSDGASSVAIQPDGKIVVAGTAGDVDTQVALARYTTAGKLDRTFAADGKQGLDFSSGNDIGSAVAVQADGKIVVAGQTNGGGGRFLVTRLRGDGEFDPTFSDDGYNTANFTPQVDDASDVAIQPDGSVVLVGSADNGTRFALARFAKSGALDDGFDDDGRSTIDFTTGIDWAGAVAIQGDGKIVAAGRAGGRGGRFALSRLLGA